MSSLLFAASCSPPATTDGGVTDAPRGDTASDATGDSSSGHCTGDPECSDGMFCNGAERCMPSAPNADVRGCVSASPMNPCLAGQVCDEAADMCRTACATDADMDGHRATECGGDDCNDMNPNIHPGATETCDTSNRDEDCDPTTFGRDMDGDGAQDHACCNIDSAGAMQCGTDCNDMNAAAHPGATEVCDAANVDEDCDGVPNPVSLCPCTAGQMRPCSLPGACAAGNELCISGAWSMCSIHPATETCNGIDDDCDGMTDEGLARDFFRDADHDGYGDDTMHMMGCTAPAGYIAYDSTAIDCDDTMITVNRRVMLYPDFDRDGHGARTGELLCPGAAGYVMDSLDCNDQNADVTPDQRNFFAVPYTTTCSTPPCPDSFDYNCDATETRKPAIYSTSTCLGSCSSSGTCSGSGYSYTGFPACGSMVDYNDCGSMCMCMAGGSLWIRSPLPCQ